MNDLKRVSLVAVLFLVLLRMSIGWQFLYEGLWKHDTLDTAHPWSSEGYLKNAQGPLRDTFRELTGDPDDLNWLDYAKMSAKWDRWKAAFVEHYAANEEQQAELTKKLDVLLDGKAENSVVIEEIPAAAQEAMQSFENAKDGPSYDPATRKFTAPGNSPLLPSQAATLLSKVDVVEVPGGYSRRPTDDRPLMEIVPPDPVELKFYETIQKLQQESAKLGYRQKLAASLKGNPDRVGVLAVPNDKGGYDTRMATDVDESDFGKRTDADVEWLKVGEIEEYRLLLNEHKRMLAQIDTDKDYEVEHLSRIAKKLQASRAAVVGPVRALEADLKKAAQRLLTAEQVARGALPPEQTQLWKVDQATIWGLVILGSLLILGFCSRLAALGGAVMLVMFYLPVPPWPGVPYPQELLGPEHSYIINKNLIEAIALLGIASLPTGSWFGVDGLIRWMFRRGGTASPQP